ncbi:MAG: hypothetical protein KTR14_11230 [Vampirovibrio sp.]|nr:hypothetical protein [Vampirovibrio sp.]
MHSTFQPWETTFDFSKDLEDLESRLTLQTLAELNNSQNTADMTAAQLMDQLARQVAQRLKQSLPQQQLGQGSGQHDELLQDNRVMARQVQHLINENARLQSELQTFRRVAGNVYYRDDEIL